jgi:hypothetical protein
MYFLFDFILGSLLSTDYGWLIKYGCLLSMVYVSVIFTYSKQINSKQLKLKDFIYWLDYCSCYCNFKVSFFF